VLLPTASGNSSFGQRDERERGCPLTPSELERPHTIRKLPEVSTTHLRAVDHPPATAPVYGLLANLRIKMN
jgi:hypothetical protein